MFTLLLDATSGLTPIAILRHGTDAQRQRFLPGLLATMIVILLLITYIEPLSLVLIR